MKVRECYKCGVEMFVTDDKEEGICNKCEELVALRIKVERYEKALDDIKNLSTLNEYADADINGLLNACFKTANDVRPYNF